MDFSSLGSVRRADLAVPQIQTTVPSERDVAKKAKCLPSRAAFLVSVMSATKEAVVGLFELYAIDGASLESERYSHSEVLGKAFPRAAYACIRADFARSSAAITAETVCCSAPATGAHAKHTSAAIHIRFIGSSPATWGRLYSLPNERRSRRLVAPRSGADRDNRIQALTGCFEDVGRNLLPGMRPRVSLAPIE